MLKRLKVCLHSCEWTNELPVNSSNEFLLIFYHYRYPFDGDGGILAHAFFPYEQLDLGGDIHFDNDEQWIDKLDQNSDYGIDFFTVALHELGHSLGLAHSPVATAVMFPYYKEYGGGQPQLDYDDILGMYNLYSK